MCVAVSRLVRIQIKPHDNEEIRKDFKARGINTTMWIQEDGTIPPANWTLKSCKPGIKGSQDYLRTVEKYSEFGGYPVDIFKDVAKQTKMRKKQKQADNRSETNHKAKFAKDCMFSGVLSLALLHGGMDPKIVSIIHRYMNTIKRICQDKINVDEMTRLQEEIIEAISMLETVLPKSEFAWVMHASIHMPQQHLLFGPARESWEFGWESSLGYSKHLAKGKNNAHMEASLMARLSMMELIKILECPDTPLVQTESNSEAFIGAATASSLSEEDRLNLKNISPFHLDTADDIGWITSQYRGCCFRHMKIVKEADSTRRRRNVDNVVVLAGEPGRKSLKIAKVHSFHRVQAHSQSFTAALVDRLPDAVEHPLLDGVWYYKDDDIPRYVGQEWVHIDDITIKVFTSRGYVDEATPESPHERNVKVPATFIHSIRVIRSNTGPETT